MDANLDGSIDYNDVVEFIEKWKATNSMEERSRNNHLFWSVIDQHKVNMIFLYSSLRLY
jgi:hypothetical protein